MSIPSLDFIKPNYNIVEVHQDPNNVMEDPTLSLVKLAHELNLTQEDLEELAYRLGVEKEMLTPEDLSSYSRSKSESSDNKQHHLSRRMLSSLFSSQSAGELIAHFERRRIHVIPDPNGPPVQPYIPDRIEAAQLAAIAGDNRHIQQGLNRHPNTQNTILEEAPGERERVEKYNQQFKDVLERQNQARSSQKPSQRDEIR